MILKSFEHLSDEIELHCEQVETGMGYMTFDRITTSIKKRGAEYLGDGVTLLHQKIPTRFWCSYGHHGGHSMRYVSLTRIHPQQDRKERCPGYSIKAPGIPPVVRGVIPHVLKCVHHHRYSPKYTSSRFIRVM